jgi:hypothetical protein
VITSAKGQTNVVDSSVDDVHRFIEIEFFFFVESHHLLGSCLPCSVHLNSMDVHFWQLCQSYILCIAF